MRSRDPEWPEGSPGLAPVCDYCRNITELVRGSVVYPRHPRLANKPIWLCKPCKAWVGCHPGTFTPLGRLANAALRRAKMDAHAAFDPLWKRKVSAGMRHHEARSRGYKWLAAQLRIDPADCHIGHFDVETCRRVVEVCQPYRARQRDDPLV